MSGDEALELVDSNVLVYLHDSSAGHKQDRARELVDRLWLTRRGCLSIQVLQELYVNVTRKVPRPLSPEVAWQVVAALGSWRTHRPTVEDVLAAIKLQQRYRISFWDAMILNSARVLGCSVVWSEDLNAGQNYDGVRVVNPF